MQFQKLTALAFTLFVLFFISCNSTKNDGPATVTPVVQDSLHLSGIPEQVQEIISKPEKAELTAFEVAEMDTQLDSIFNYLHTKKGFNGTVLVSRFDKIIYKGAFGYADFRNKDTLCTQTAFQLASVSKQFTAMAIMMLKEQGRLNYEDSVQQYLPSFPYSGITIRQLLTHRSGLSNYTYFSDKLWPDRKQFMTNDDVLNMMELHRPEVYYKPDTRYDYSNTGYFILASIVEKASGMDFSDFLHSKIFEPLQMNQTFTYKGDSALPAEKIATGYARGKRKRPHDYLDTVLGDKGIYSTVEDLYKWDQALYTQRLVSQATLEEAFSGSRIKKKKAEDYGFGWRIRELDSGDKVVFHAGLWHGFNTYMLRNPKDHSAIIILSNFQNGSLKYLKDIQAYLYPAPTDVYAGNFPEQTDELGGAKN